MKNSAFLTAFRFYARILTGVLAAAGFVSLIALQTGWLALSKADDHLSRGDELNVNAEEPALAAEGFRILMSQMIPVDPSLTYDLSAEVRSIGPADVKNAVARTYLGVATFDAGGKEIRGGPGTYRYAGAINFQLYSAAGWMKLSGSATGEGDETHDQFRPGTKYVRIVALLNYRNANAPTESDRMTTEIRNVRFAPRVKMNLNN